MVYEIDPSRYTRHDSLVDAAAQRHRVSQALIKAVIMAESGFNAAAYREEPQIKDASRGLMQMLLSTARWLGFDGAPEELYDPATAIEYGTRYLGRLLGQFGDERLAVAAYNAGPGTVDRLCRRHGHSYDAIEPYLPRVTRAYVPRVMAYREQFAAYHRDQGLAICKRCGAQAEQLGSAPSPGQRNGVTWRRCTKCGRQWSTKAGVAEKPAAPEPA